MEQRKVISMSRSFSAIEADHPDQWIVIQIEDARRERGHFVCAASEMNAPEIAAAIRQVHTRGRDVALRYSGNFIPEGTIVAF